MLYDVIRQKRVIGKRIFFQNVSMIILIKSYHNKHLLKIKLKCLKRGLIQQITEKQQNDDTNYVIPHKEDMV